MTAAMAGGVEPSGTGLSFADELRRHRLEARLTQEELARLAGISVRGLSDLERGIRRAPYPDTVERLGKALGLDEEQIRNLRRARRPASSLAQVVAASDAVDAQFEVAGRPCPYVGLAPFTYATRDRYAGRELQVREALGSLVTTG